MDFEDLNTNEEDIELLNRQTQNRNVSYNNEIENL